MGKLGGVFENQSSVTFEDFSGGLNSVSSDSRLRDGELSAALNVVYDSEGRTLESRKGLSLKKSFAFTVTGLFYNEIEDYYIVTGAGKAHLVSADFGSVVELGSLTGNKAPMFSLWESGVLIASGGSLQFYDNTSLSTIAITNPVDSSDLFPDIVLIRRSRVLIASTDGSTVFYSGVGDETNWDFSGTDADAQFFGLQSDLFDKSKISAVAQLSVAVIVFKDNGSVYKIVNDPLDATSIETFSRSSNNVGRFTAEEIGNDVGFLRTDGFGTIGTVDQFGDVKLGSIGDRVVNRLTSAQSPSGYVSHIQKDGKVYVNTNAGNAVYVFQVVNKAWTQLQYPFSITSIVEGRGGSAVFISGANVYTEANSSLDAGQAFEQRISSKRYLSKNRYIFLRARVNYKVDSIAASASSTLFVGGKSIPLSLSTNAVDIYLNTGDIYLNTDDIFQFSENDDDKRFRKRSGDLRIDVVSLGTRIALSSIVIDFAEVL